MPSEINLYTYVQGNPVSAIDTDGERTDFNVGVNPTYDQLPKWSELTKEQRVVETIAIGVVGTVAAAPIAVTVGAVAAPFVGKATLAASVKAYAGQAAVLGAAAAEVGYMASAAKDAAMRVVNSVSLPQVVTVVEKTKDFLMGYGYVDPPQNGIQTLGAAVNYVETIKEYHNIDLTDFSTYPVSMSSDDTGSTPLKD